jgi:hypothetical protein
LDEIGAEDERAAAEPVAETLDEAEAAAERPAFEEQPFQEQPFEEQPPEASPVADVPEPPVGEGIEPEPVVASDEEPAVQDEEATEDEGAGVDAFEATPAVDQGGETPWAATEAGAGEVIPTEPQTPESQMSDSQPSEPEPEWPAPAPWEAQAAEPSAAEVDDEALQAGTQPIEGRQEPEPAAEHQQEEPSEEQAPPEETPPRKDDVRSGPGWIVHSVVSRPAAAGTPPEADKEGPETKEKRPLSASSNELEKIRRILNDLD